MPPDLPDCPTPYYLVDEAALTRNLAVLDEVQRRSGARVLLALKAFAMPAVFPLLRETLAGTAASSLAEARLGFETFGDSVHLCAPAYRDEEIGELLGLCRHVVFNSFSQWRRHRPRLADCARPPACGIRVNPEHSEVRPPIYDPCQPRSRLGVRRAHFEPEALDGITGLHLHNLCGSDAGALERTLERFESGFGPFLSDMRWLNLGGGHHITRPGYDVERLCRMVGELRERYGVEVFLEPGEAVVLDAGWLVATVLDVLPDGVAVLDASASAHAPDVLEMPYRPDLDGAGPPGAHPHDYRLGGPTCLAGDYFGDYSFPEPLRPGDRVAFEDMACYTMVKNTTFNGVRLPSIVLRGRDGETRVLRRFGDEAYRGRLA